MGIIIQFPSGARSHAAEPAKDKMAEGLTPPEVITFPGTSVAYLKALYEDLVASGDWTGRAPDFSGFETRTRR